MYTFVFYFFNIFNWLYKWRLDIQITVKNLISVRSRMYKIQRVLFLCREKYLKREIELL